MNNAALASGRNIQKDIPYNRPTRGFSSSWLSHYLRQEIIFFFH